MTEAGPQFQFCDAAWSSLAERLGLSSRELQIISMLLNDEKEFAMAQHLGISIHTVHTHLERLYHKLGVNSRLQLAVILMRWQLELIAEPGSLLPPLCGNRAAGHCPLAG